MLGLQTKRGYDRVREHTSESANVRIDLVTDGHLRHALDEPDTIPQRLAELDREWDIDRVIMVQFAAMGSVALALGLRRNSRWRFPLAAQVGFLLAHAVIGWCPPAAVLRRLKFRTRQEIEAERHALLAAIGRDLPAPHPS